MKLLLDTQMYWWWSERNSRLSSIMRASIEQAEQVYVSLASFWEIAIKTRTEKLKGEPLLALGMRGLEANGFLPLAIEYRHVLGTMDLPLYHRDPFDRLLIAQARAEALTIVSSDTIFERYGVERIW